MNNEYFSYFYNYKRYADWFDKYVGHRYKSKIGAHQEEHTFLTGNDCYALRCSYLHEGKLSFNFHPGAHQSPPRPLAPRRASLGIPSYILYIR